MLDRRHLLLAAGASLLPIKSRADPAKPLPGSEISILLKKQISDRASAGIIAAVLDRDGWRFVPAGNSGSPDGRPLNGDTVFQIASVTKLFTSLLLTDMSVRGEVALDDPVGKYLPPHIHMPNYHGQAITLRDLVTYTSGLPGWPPNLPPLDKSKPFPDYPINQLYVALNGYKLLYAPGTHYAYTNFGFGLLGQVLSRRAGVSYEDLVVSRICTPLGMDSTRVTLTPSLRARLAPGHDVQLKPIETWSFPPAFQAAGSFVSTTNDLLKFLRAAMGLEPSSLTAAFAAMLKPRRSADYPGLSVAAGWFVMTGHKDELIFKNGDTQGYTSFIGFSPKSRRGVVLLATGECGRILTPLGWHLLNPDFPLKKLG